MLITNVTQGNHYWNWCKPLGAKFEYSYDANNLAPATVKFKNVSAGATRYEWTFEKADKTTSTEENPTVTFAEKGGYKVSLKAFNGLKFLQFDSTIQVGENLSPAFVYDVIDFNFGQEALPLLIKVANTSKGSINATKMGRQRCQCKNNGPNDSVTTILLPKQKHVKVSMTASNGKVSKTDEKKIVVNPTTNLLFLERCTVRCFWGFFVFKLFCKPPKTGNFCGSIRHAHFWERVGHCVFSLRTKPLGTVGFYRPDRAENLLISRPSLKRSEPPSSICWKVVRPVPNLPMFNLMPSRVQKTSVRLCLSLATASSKGLMFKEPHAMCLLQDRRRAIGHYQ